MINSNVQPTLSVLRPIIKGKCLLHIIAFLLLVFQLLIANDYNSIAVNVNAYRAILEIQKIEMAAD